MTGTCGTCVNQPCVCPENPSSGVADHDYIPCPGPPCSDGVAHRHECHHADCEPTRAELLDLLERISRLQDKCRLQPLIRETLIRAGRKPGRLKA